MTNQPATQTTTEETLLEELRKQSEILQNIQTLPASSSSQTEDEKTLHPF
jgi:hypothetical protein